MLGPPDGPILDLGCGNGAIARELLWAGYDVYGVDASETGIAQARAEWPDRFYVHDLSRAVLPHEISAVPFTTVISTEVIEHLYNPRALLRTARGVLPKGGRLIISTPYHGYLKNLALAISSKLDDHFTVLWDGGHIKFFSRRTLEQMLREIGFLPTRFFGAGRFPRLWKSMLFEAKSS
jgi:2-polyprenyl-3-methyl-5-hydroxy-6-metoxy-1,4-benzoquinol methylase